MKVSKKTLAFIFALCFISNSFALYNDLFKLKLEAGAAVNDLAFHSANFDNNFDSTLSEHYIEKDDDSFYGGIGIRKKIDDILLLELLYGYTSAADVQIREKFTDDTNGYIRTNTDLVRHLGFINAYVTPTTFSYYFKSHKIRFQTFFQVGVGAAFNKVDDLKFYDNRGLIMTIKERSRGDFAWNAGLGFSLNDLVSFGYRFLDAPDPRFEKTIYPNTALFPTTTPVEGDSIKIGNMAHIFYVGVSV